MNSFIKKLIEDLGHDDIKSSGPIPDKIQSILTKLVYKEPFISKLFSRLHTDYIADSSMSTAGVMPKLGRIQFYYNPEFINKLSEAELNFLLKHELYHIFRSHSKRGSAAGATTERLHYLANIAMDCLINEDCKNEPGFGGLPTKVIEKAWFIDAPSQQYSSVNDIWGRDENDNYSGEKITENLYKWILERDKEAQQKQQKQQKQGQGQGQQSSWEPSIGDIVYNKKSNQYGKIVNRYGKNVKVEPISETEAKDILSKSSFINKKKDLGDDFWL